jgi:16S rRNA (cytosine967-C5)-methyltransferase
MPLPTARGVAATVLVRVLSDGAFASAVLDAEVSRVVQLDVRDRALATELVYGSLRVVAWLDQRIARHAPRGIESLDPRTHAELLLSAYQLFFLERVPAFAAVNEAVEAVKQARGPRVAAFANAVLRRLAEEAKTTKGPALLLEAAQASLPAWIGEALARSLGEEGARAFCAASMDPPPLGLRVASAGDRDACRERLAREVPHARFEAGRVSPLAILARGGGKSDVWPGFDKAWSVQEEGSQVVALALGVRPGDLVLDACAGRGNKSTVLARAAMPGGALDVADLYPTKLSRLARQLQQAGLPLRAAHAVDWSVGAGDVGSGYDRALVDAPCSGIGTLRRRPDLVLRREAADLARLASLQATIVLRVATRLRPGGRLVYAVCSVLQEEAEAVVSAVTAADPGLALVPFDGEVLRELAREQPTLRLLPHVHGTDGYFLASFERRG